MRKILLLSAALISTSVFAMDDGGGGVEERKSDHAPVSSLSPEQQEALNQLEETLRVSSDIVRELDFLPEKGSDVARIYEKLYSIAAHHTQLKNHITKEQYERFRSYFPIICHQIIYKCKLKREDALSQLTYGEYVMDQIMYNEHAANTLYARALSCEYIATLFDKNTQKNYYLEMALDIIGSFLNPEEECKEDSWEMDVLNTYHSITTELQKIKGINYKKYIKKFSSYKLEENSKLSLLIRRDVLMGELDQMRLEMRAIKNTRGRIYKKKQENIRRIEGLLAEIEAKYKSMLPEKRKATVDLINNLSEFNRSPHERSEKTEEISTMVSGFERSCGLPEDSEKIDYKDFFQKNISYAHIIEGYMEFFLNTRKIDQLLARLPAFWEVILEKKTDSAEYREIEEYLQSLTFDSSKNKKKKSRSQRKRENQKKAKEAAQKAAIAQVEEARKKPEAEGATAEGSTAEAEAEVPVKATKRTQQVALPSHYASAGEISKEEEARKKRHAERLERQKREAEALAAAVAAGGGGGSGSAAATGAGAKAGAGASDEESSLSDHKSDHRRGPVLDRRGDFSLVGLYKLNKSAADFDAAFRKPSTKITKKNLVKYLKALGGTELSPGHAVGSHNTKINFDKINGHSITLAKLGFDITERSFALLSMDENEEVPTYIIGQIQLLREKLKALKEAEATDEPADDSSEYDDGDA
jgi:hypothetical protein